MDVVKIYYKNFFIDEVKYTDYILDFLRKNKINHDYKVECDSTAYYTNRSYQLIFKKNEELRLFCEKFKIVFKKNIIEKIIEIDLIENSLMICSENHNNFLDLYIIDWKIFSTYNSIVAKRILNDVCELSYCESSLSNYFLLRDIIETITTYMYIVKEKSNLSENNVVSEKVMKILKNQTKSKILENKELKKLIELSNFHWYIDKIFEIKKNCNQYIHQNGYERIDANYFKKDNRNIYEDMLITIKFYFICVSIYSPEILASTDYVDYLDMSEIPPENSQYWICSIFSDFFKTFFTDLEIEELSKLSCMELRAN